MVGFRNWILCLSMVGSSAFCADEVNTLSERIALVVPLAMPLGPPLPGDWMENHKEGRQLFSDYLSSNPSRITEDRTVIYIQPLGELSPEWDEQLNKAGAYLGTFYGVKVQRLVAMSDDVVPGGARRYKPNGAQQLNTQYILRQVMPPKLPPDAFAYLLFTELDLWPGSDNYNFVFGESNVNGRVGVWSFARLGDGDSKLGNYLSLRRTLRVATHETAHLFSMAHCTVYRCGMNGANNVWEMDRQPLEFCPECLAKVCWATKVDPLVRARALESLLSDLGLESEAVHHRHTAQLLGGWIGEE